MVYFFIAGLIVEYGKVTKPFGSVRRMPFVDLHCDTISRLLACRRAGVSAGLRRGPGGHISLEKLRESGYLLQTFALFVNLREVGDPTEEVFALAELYRRELEENRDWAAPVTSFAEMEQARKDGKVACLLSVEEGGVCRGDVEVLRRLYRLGTRMMTLTWNYENELGRPNGRAGGLTEAGFAFLEEMERLRMLPDVSHLSDDGFWAVCRAAKRPFLASHSSCRALREHPRNLTDDMIRAIADRGGIVGVNFYANFLGDSPVTRTEDIVRHLRHLVDVGGLGVAALGSDFDGIDCALEMGDAGCMDRLVAALEGGKFSAGEIEAVCWRNAWRFFRENL